jgi:uncharacterized membrane protein
VIPVAVIAGLFSVWWHSNLNDEDGMFAFVPRLLYRHPWSKKWLMCPWCSGAWFAIIPSLILLHDPLDVAIITAFAAAAIAGIIGMYVQGD